MDFTIVKLQIISQYVDLYGSDQPDSIWSLGACIDVFRYYYRRYEEIFEEEPPHISNRTVKEIIEKFPYLTDEEMGKEFDLSPDDYPVLIDAYFEQDFEACDYSIAHFMSGKIRLLRYYEALY